MQSPHLGAAMTKTVHIHHVLVMPEALLLWAKQHRLKLHTGRVQGFRDREDDDFDKAVLTSAHCLPSVISASSVTLTYEDPVDPLEETCFFLAAYRLIFRVGPGAGVQLAFFLRPQ
jgi:hypothetical protein